MFRQTLSAAVLTVVALTAQAEGTTSPLAGAPVRSGGTQTLYAAEGVVEAVRQSVISPQVAGVITRIEVKAGDAVRPGQVLARIDARAAEQTTAAAQAELDAAENDYARQRQLFEQKFISHAALERAEARFKIARGQAGATLAQSGFYTLSAPYAGLVADLPAMPGDMAMPGQPLMTVYDPALLRVTVSVPQSVVAGLTAGRPVEIELPGLPPAQRRQTATRMTVLPMADAGTHTVQIRLDLAPGLQGLTPGMFARAWLPLVASAAQRLFVPATAVFRRAELTMLYVLNQEGKPSLRQIRTGPALGDEIEVLSGVSAGDRVAIEPLAAARVR